MAVIILPGGQNDLLSLQEYMLDKWGVAAWLKAEDEIFDKLEQVDTGLLRGMIIHELSAVGILDYYKVHTSHHKIVYRTIHNDTYVYVVAHHRQDFPSVLMRRLMHFN